MQEVSNDKCKHTKYGHLPPKEAEAIPWDRLCVDCIGPYKIPINSKNKPFKKKDIRVLNCVTMIDPATGWFELKDVDQKTADTIANAVEQTWLTRYPWPTMINYDRGTEFMAEFAKMITNEYDIEKKPISSRNP